MTKLSIITLGKKPSLTQTIRPSRFVWHVSAPYNDLSIAAYGLECPENNAVFAHNNLKSFDDMYPYFLDFWDIDFREISIDGIQFCQYSYWRIDTSKLNINWYVDPEMEGDCSISCINSNPRNFICTPNSIPTYALELFEFDYSLYKNRPPFLTRGDGIVSASPRRTDFDCLVPEKEGVNEYKDWRLRNAQTITA
jgi:hypothetical protein